MKILYLAVFAGIAIFVMIISVAILLSQPKKIEGLENDSGLVNLENHAYYFATVNDTMTTYRGEGVQELLHGVVFTFFPKPFSGGPPGSCGNSNFGADVKFQDGTHELLGVGVPSMPCAENYIQTDLSNHTNPQAGLAVYDGKIKLLVDTEKSLALTSSTIAQGIENQYSTNQTNYPVYQATLQRTMNVANTKFSVNYTITNATIQSIEIDAQAKKQIIVSIHTIGNGILRIDIPQELVNSILVHHDTKLIVVVGGKLVDYNEVETPFSDRILTIPFTQGVGQIVIIGEATT